MRSSLRMPAGNRARRRILQLSIAAGCIVAGLVAAQSAAAQSAWNWSGSYADNAVELLILGDIQVFREDPSSAFVHVRETLNRADLVYANYEGMLVASRCVGCTKDFRRRTPGEEVRTIDIPGKENWVHPGPEGVVGLKAANVAVVGIANNVAYGTESIVETMRVLDANGIAYAGGGMNVEEAHAPAIVERNDITFGFLQYTARWYDQEEQMATADQPGIARILSIDGISIDPYDLDRLREDIRKARRQVDILIVSQHNRRGGTEVQFGETEVTPKNPQIHPGDRDEYQELFARVALDAGADLVFGHGNHSLDGVDLYKGKPILYNIAHSNFDQPGYEDATEGLVVRVVVQGPPGLKTIQRVSFVPVTRDDNNDVLMLDPSTGEGARIMEFVKSVSPGVPLQIDSQEMVLLDESTGTMTTMK